MSASRLKRAREPRKLTVRILEQVILMVVLCVIPFLQRCELRYNLSLDTMAHKKPISKMRNNDEERGHTISPELPR